MTNNFEKEESIVSFLVAAHHECINSVLLNDLLSKIEILKQQDEFSGLLADFNTETIMPVLQKLEKLDVIHTYRNGSNIEIMSTNPIAQASVWEQQLTEKEKALYLQMAQSYRMIETEPKSPKVKGI